LDTYTPFWLNLLALLTEVTQQAVIKSIEEVASELGHAREDVPGTGTIFASLQPGSKLTCSCTPLSGLVPWAGNQSVCVNAIRFCTVVAPYSYFSGTGSTVDMTGGRAAEARRLPQLVLHTAGAKVCVVSCGWQQAVEMQRRRIGTLTIQMQT